MFEFEYDLARSRGRGRDNSRFGKIKVVDSGDNVFLIKGGNGSGKTMALMMLETALGGSPARVPARLKLTSLDGKTCLESSVGPFVNSTLNGKQVDYRHPVKLRAIWLEIQDILSKYDGIDRLFDYSKSGSTKERFEQFLSKLATFNSGSSVLLIDNYAPMDDQWLDKRIVCLRDLTRRGKLMAAVITVLDK